MPVVAVKTELKCKICKSPHRDEIDALLEKRSNRETDSEGRKINLEYVLAQMGAWEIPNPNNDNVTLHWKKHCEVITVKKHEDVKKEKEAYDAMMAEEAQAVFILVLGEGWEQRPISNDQYVELVRNLSARELALKAKRNQPMGVTVDQGLKAVGESTKRKSNEAREELMSSLVGGLTQALTGPSRQIAEHEPVIELEEGEYTEV